MSGQLQHVITAVAMGTGATLVMDSWNLFLKRTLGIASLNYCLLGRWVRHLPSGTFVHRSISQSAPQRFECVVGWLAHYSIGIALAVLFVRIISDDWLARPSAMPALLYGIATVVFPFFILQPAIGLGLASSRAANPTKARIKSVATHVVFGAGLYVSALLATYLTRG